MNSTFSRKVERQIDDSNQQLVRRLQRASSAYSQRSMSKAVRNYTKFKTNLAASKMEHLYDLEGGCKSAQIDNLKTRPYTAKR